MGILVNSVSLVTHSDLQADQMVEHLQPETKGVKGQWPCTIAYFEEAEYGMAVTHMIYYYQ